MTASLSSDLAAELDILAWKARSLACRVRLGDSGVLSEAMELSQRLDSEAARARELVAQIEAELGGSLDDPPFCGLLGPVVSP